MTFDQRGWLFTLAMVAVSAPVFINEFAPKSDERATSAKRVVTPKGANVHSSTIAGVRNFDPLQSYPGLSNELGHKVTPVIPTGVAQSPGIGQPGTSPKESASPEGGE